MLELLFLLLPIAAVYGWYMGYRKAKKTQDDINNKFSKEYAKGLDFLLSNQHDKAVNLFLKILAKPDENISRNAKFNAELTLGNLFRSRGEIDQALRIHQNLLTSVDYSFEQKLLAKQQLAQDFMYIGFYDRAESLYISLVDEPAFFIEALENLALIYQKSKDWNKAINVSEKLAQLVPNDNNIRLANYYCEYALQCCQNNPAKFKQLLTKALTIAPSSVRTSILLAELLIKQKDYKQAIPILEHILEQKPAYIGEVIGILKDSYTAIKKLKQFELFLIKANNIQKNTAIELALIDLIEEFEDQDKAQTFLYSQLQENTSLNLLKKFIQYQINNSSDLKTKNNFKLLHDNINKNLNNDLNYCCTNCGYKTSKLYWCCKSCQDWETSLPIETLQPNK